MRWASRFLTEHDFDVPLYDAPLERIEIDVTFLFVPGMLNGLLDVPISNRVEMPLLHGHHWDLSYPHFPTVLSAGLRNLEHPGEARRALAYGACMRTT